jgi:hypothetical protein
MQSSENSDRRNRFIRSVATLFVVATVTLCGCVSSHHTAGLSGKYVNRDTGGFILFKEDGGFYYSFTNPAPQLLEDGLPMNKGEYYFLRPCDLQPVISVRSAHTGMFEFRFSPTREKIFLTHTELSSGEIEFQRE